MAVWVSQTAFAFEFNRIPAGQIQGVRLSWVSASSIKLGVGYGEVMGSYWEITPTNSLVTTGYTLTGLTTSTNGVFHYIYIDRLNSSLPDVTIKNSATAPTWSDDFMGWYNGPDRCIGVVWVNPAGNVTNFYCPDDVTYQWYVREVVAGGTVTTAETWNSLNLTAFVPANVTHASVLVSLYYASGTAWTNCRAGLAVTGFKGQTERYDGGVNKAAVGEWLPFARAGSRSIDWLAMATQSGSTASVGVQAFKIER